MQVMLMLPIWVLTIALVALVIWAGSKHEDPE
jgi:flagellar basal body-associated protein FliL